MHDPRPWLKHYDPEVPASLDYEEMPLYGLLDRAADEHPQRTAVIFRNWKISYAKLRALADAMAANLQDMGVRPGDRVAIMLPNLPQTILTFWAALKAGAVVVMTNPLYMEKELVHQLSDAGCEYLVVLDHLWPRIEPLRDRLPIRKYIVTTIPDGLCFPLTWLYALKARRDKLPREVPLDGRTVLPWKPLLKGGRTPTDPKISPREDLALLQYTGGTTGRSKGVMLSHFNLTTNVRQCLAMLHGLGDNPEVMLGLLPYFHVYGLTVCLTLGTAIAATLIPFPRYAPKDLLEAVRQHKPTIFPGAPSVYTSLMQQKELPNYDLRCINYCVSGSAALPRETLRRFQELTEAYIIEGYGLTEASPVTHLNPLHGEKKVGSIGLPFPDTDCCIVDLETGERTLAPGEIGELVIEGPQVMQGYWNQPEETAQALRDGRLYTGDIAYMDAQGYFHIVDRKRDMIIVGGYNVYPRDIDEVLLEHPKVLEAVAVGIPHPRRGEIIKAYVVPEPGQELETWEIVSHCRKKLANYKVPRQVEFRKELPKSLVGKVLRQTLRNEEEEKLKES